LQLFGAPWPDAVTALIALITAPLGVFALFQTRKALGAQAAASDMQTAISVA
jgi:hypothetical protein